MNIFDSAIIIAAIAGGITGALVAVVVSLGVIRAQRHLGDIVEAQRSAKQLGELDRHGLRGRRIRVGQHGDAMQRVEEEVRLKLHLHVAS